MAHAIERAAGCEPGRSIRLWESQRPTDSTRGRIARMEAPCRCGDIVRNMSGNRNGPPRLFSAAGRRRISQGPRPSRMSAPSATGRPEAAPQNTASPGGSPSMVHRFDGARSMAEMVARTSRSGDQPIALAGFQRRRTQRRTRRRIQRCPLPGSALDDGLAGRDDALIRMRPAILHDRCNDDIAGYFGTVMSYPIRSYNSARVCI